MIPRSALCLALLAALPAPVAHAEDALPRPSVDFTLQGRTATEKATVRIAHSGGRIRLDIAVSGVPGTMTSLLDTRRHRIVVLSGLPGMQNVGVEMELPEDYAFLDPPKAGIRVGGSNVLGESCDVWRAKVKGRIDTIDACITPDGIVLRAEAGTEAQRRMVFEATELVRGPQDPSLFDLPRGVKVTRIPKGMQSLMPDLLPDLTR